MKNLIIIFSIILTTTRGCDGCKKNDDEPTKCNGFVPYPQKLKDYLLFKDSSYWIYQDSASGMLDSAWVTNFKKRDDDWPHERKGTKDLPCYEQISYNLNREKYNYIEKILLYSRYINKGLENEAFYVDYIRSENGYARAEIRFVTQNYDSIIERTAFGEGIVKQHENFNVKNKDYTDILHLYYPITNPHDWVRSIYYSKHIGVIKYQDEEGKIWELIRYKVKQ